MPYILDINNIYKPKHIYGSLRLHHGDVVVCVEDRSVLVVVPRLVRAPDVGREQSSASLILFEVYKDFSQTTIVTLADEMLI